jgi:hypothetical protein
MSLRYSNGAIIKPGFNPVLVPAAPTIGLVTPGAGQVIVAFTAPTDTGGSAITSYQVVSSPGSVVATGASSPITVTGLTNGTAYTFRVAAINSYGAGTFSAASASATPVVSGQQAYTSAGTFTWVAPTGVTSVSVVAVGGGGGTSSTVGAGGGELRYKNNISVTPGSSYTVVVGRGGIRGCNTNINGIASTFNSTTVIANPGLYGGSGGAGGSGGTGDGGGNGGNGAPPLNSYGSGGGAGGYSGTGGNGGNNNTGATAPTAGSGGGGGGGGAYFATNYLAGYGGGGVGILGEGASGAAGTSGGGGGGSGGAAGCTTPFASGGAYGGGGGSSNGTCNNGGSGGVGAVRIIWPGTTRSFPSTNTGNL